MRSSATASKVADSTKPLTVTVATARKISGLGNTTIWALIKRKELEVVRVGGRTLISFRSLEALLDPGKYRSGPAKATSDKSD